MMSCFCYYFVNSEYKPLKAVLLYKPTPAVESVNNPKNVLYLNKIDYRKINKEYRKIIETYRSFSIKVYFINAADIDVRYKSCLYNMMYTRDLLFITPGGAIISKMASNLRRHEVKYAKKALIKIDIPVIMNIKNKGIFEGADALWVNEKLIMIGVGNRTNKEGFLQIRDELKNQGINCIQVPAPKNTQHLLGAVQFVDSDCALLRINLIDKRIVGILMENGIKFIELSEDKEVRKKQAMNVVAIAPRKIIMPSDCPETKKIYKNHGVKIAAEIQIKQLINGGGGLACATAILSRVP